jgi:ribosomal protein S18 acetylase RimI-like enzyme
MVTDRLRRHPNAADFLLYSLDFLAARQAQNHLLLGLALTLKNSAAWDESFYSFGPDKVEGAFVYAPSRGMLVSASCSPRSIEAMVADSMALGREMAGIAGPRPDADQLAGAWTFAGGGPMALSVAGFVYQLRELNAPSPAAGAARLAGPGDISQVVDWSRSLALESGEFFDAEYAMLAAQRRVDAGELWLWTDPEPVSMMRISSTGAGGFRIRAVFTPASRRNRGYASSLLSHAILAALRPPDAPCFLDTSAANTVANRIYRKLGFRQVGEVAQFKPI